VKKFKIKSFCKVNLYLKVIKKRRNGYHDITSLISFCDLYDTISISINKTDVDKISFSGKFKNAINNKKNTLSKILYILRKKKLLKNKGFVIKVQKNIPHGSGLGGGSANAANLLKFLNLKMKLKLNSKEMNKIANKVGFDVPVCLEKKNSLFTGKKNEILRLKNKFKYNILIICPNVRFSTRKIYKYNKTFSQPINRFNFKKNDKKMLINFLRMQKNDLEPSAIKIYPKIKKVINLMKYQNGCYFSRITGSGSACIGIFSSMKNAVFTQKLMKIKFPKYWCVVSKTI